MGDRTFTAREKQQAAARELGFRRRVYATRVAEGRMKQVEQSFHQRFAHLRESGEWFRLEGDLAQFLESGHVSC